MKKIHLLNCSIDSLDMCQTVKLIEKYIGDRKQCQHVVVNVSKLIAMQNDDKLRSIVSSCKIVNADGMPIVWLSKMLKTPLPCRVTGIDLFLNLIDVCSEKKYRPYFLGAKHHVLNRMIKKITTDYPDIDIAGHRNGYFSPEEEPQIALDIKNSNADILFVGFSSPNKELFLHKWIETMKVPFCMGVGGSFDILAGETRRAPYWMQNAGLEWFYRVIQEPKRMWKRYALTIPPFVLLCFKELAKKA